MATEVSPDWLCPRFTLDPETNKIYRPSGRWIAVVDEHGVVRSSPEYKCIDEVARSIVNKATCLHCQKEKKIIQEREEKFYGTIRQTALMILSPFLIALIIAIIYLTHPYWVS